MPAGVFCRLPGVNFEYLPFSHLSGMSPLPVPFPKPHSIARGTGLPCDVFAKELHLFGLALGILILKI